MNTITVDEEKDLRNFVAKKTRALAAPGGKTPLNPNRTDNLECTLWTMAVKAVIRCDPAKSPLVPFVKAVINRSAYREAAREFNRQVKAGENPWADESLDAPVADDEGGETPFGDTIAEPAEVTATREDAAFANEVLSSFGWQRQYALRSMMYDDVTADEASRFLGVSRPTLKRIVDSTVAMMVRRVRENPFTPVSGSADRP